MGLILTGAGLSITIEAGLLKENSSSAWQWIALGALGLVLFNSGLALLAKAAVLLAEMRRNKDGV